MIISLYSCGMNKKIHQLKSPLRYNSEVATPLGNNALWW